MDDQGGYTPRGATPTLGGAFSPIAEEDSAAAAAAAAEYEATATPGYTGAAATASEHGATPGCEATPGYSDSAPSDGSPQDAALALTPPSAGAGAAYPLQPQRDSFRAAYREADVLAGGASRASDGGGGAKHDFNMDGYNLDGYNLDGYNYGYPAAEPEIASIAAR